MISITLLSDESGNVAVNKYCELEEREVSNELTAYTDCKNITGIARDGIKGLNDKKFVNISTDISSIKVYSSKENINKLKANRKAHINETKARYDWYEERINELEDENNRLSEELDELKNKEEKN